MFLDIVLEDIGSGLTDRRQFLHPAGESSIDDSEPSTDHIVEEWLKRFDDHIECSCDQKGAVAKTTVLPDPGEACGVGTKKELLMEQLPRIASQLGHRRSFVAQVERTKEVPTVSTVKRKELGGLSNEVCDKRRPSGKR
jgi:hypothetical protein